ncbi:MAG: hypothetical protein JSV57_01950, partial [Candidatus Bathyarchaeota archaeon]
YAVAQGHTLAAAPEDIYGPGWWRYDPEEAAKLLEDNGFTRDAQGQWLLPSGERWTMNFVIPAFHPMASRIGYAIAEQWRAFGIDIIDEALASAMWNPRGQQGDFDTTMHWSWCGMLTDPWNWWQAWHKKYYKPIGEAAPQSQQWGRWANDEVSDLLDELGALRPDDPDVIPIVARIIQVSYEEMAFMNCYLGSKMIVSDTYVWKNWNTGDNWYWERSYWNPMWCLPVLVNLEHSGNVPFTEEEAPVTTVTETVTDILTTTETQAAETVTETETVTQLDMTSLAGAGIVALVVGVVVGWLVGSKRS